MKFQFFAGAIIVAVSAAACAQSNGPDGISTEVAIERLRSEPYALETFSGFNKPEQLVIRDVPAWGAVWAKIYDKRSPTPPLPALDFTKYMIVVAALGDRPSTGYDVLVAGASRTGEIITVRVQRAGACGAVLTVLTQPVDVAIIPRSVGSVEFEETDVTNCK